MKPSASSGALSVATGAGDSSMGDSAYDEQRMTALSDRELPFELRVLEARPRKPNPHNPGGVGRRRSRSPGRRRPPPPEQPRPAAAAPQVALESVCARLEDATEELETDAHPALDALTFKVSTANLEGVKKVKGRLTGLQGRVQKVREEINRFLEDDSDMRDMYLTRKAQARSAAAGLMGAFGRTGSESAGREPLPLPMFDPMDDDADIQQLEDLLETYFTQVDNSFNKLQVLEQFVNDTEDFINIDLDSHRNQLIEIDLMLSFGMLISSLFTLVTGIFGMNLDSGLQLDPYAFRQIVIIASGIVVIGFVVFVWICRRNRLIQLSF